MCKAARWQLAGMLPAALSQVPAHQPSINTAIVLCRTGHCRRPSGTSQFERRRTQVASQHRRFLAVRWVRAWGQSPPRQSFCSLLPYHNQVSLLLLKSTIKSCHHAVSILLFLPLQMDAKSDAQTNSCMWLCPTTRITSLSKDSRQAAWHFAQQQLQNRQFMAALLHAARCFVQTGTLTNVCLALLLFILRTRHSASGRIFQRVLPGWGWDWAHQAQRDWSRSQLKATATHGFDSRPLSRHPLTDHFGKAVPLQALVNSIKEAVFYPVTLTVVNMPGLGEVAEALLLCGFCFSTQLFCPADLAAAAEVVPMGGTGQRSLSVNRYLVLFIQTDFPS